VLGCSYEDNGKPTLAQLREHLGLDAAELRKIVLGYPAVLGYVPANVFTKLGHQQECLGLTDKELRVAVIAQPMALSYGKIKEKWALMMDNFAEEAGDQKSCRRCASWGFEGWE
jgi:hypothetical protein